MHKKKKLLLVDDNGINLKILTKILQQDYSLFTAKNGKLAIEILEKNDSIDAVILDIIMPIMDGFEVLHRMRKDPRMSQIPVIVASGYDSAQDDNKEIQALSFGANDYVTKPYKPEIIRHRIANAIYLRETAAFVNTVQHDALTGLYSKEYFYLQVEECKKNSPLEEFDMVCCDIENFKLVNDLYGTDVGDQLLKGCASSLKASIGKNGICGRIGPDIFAFFIKHKEQYSDEQFIDVIQKINRFNINLNVLLKYGIYVVSDPSVPVNLMCDRARLAIADIKGKYGVCFRYYDDSVRKKMLSEQYIVAHMKQALQSGEFEVFLQPKYELRSESIVGAEALVRWNDPEKGFLSPGDFIPLFEKNGFITDLDMYVWETCCKKIRDWINKGNVAIPISVNVSRTDLYNPNIEKIFLSLLRKYDLSPRFLYLEITESAYTENAQQLIESVLKLKKIGFKIEMDDFGTGYSSLNMLAEFPIDIVKLDIAFMQNQQKYNNRSILSFIISLAKWMNYGVIAEGVETADQVSLLRSLGCECAQGFYYARPMPAAKFEDLLLKQFERAPEVLSAQTETQEPSKLYHPSSIEVIDDTGTVFTDIQSLFSEKYEIHKILQPEYLAATIHAKSSNVEAVVYSAEENINKSTLEGIIATCRPHSIPVLAVVTSINSADIAIGIGVTDYITIPYNETGMKNRIQNMISSTKVSRFEVENEINSVISDMKKRAEQDSLTELLNRAEYENKVQEFFRDNENPTGCFIMLDVDNFKSINDNYGHAAGDNTLQAIANSLHLLFCETDLIGRIGGDEFSLFIPYSIDEQALKIKVNKLCSALDFKLNNTTITCSVGICFSPENGKDFQTLYQNADTALLHAKQNGKSQFRLYKQGMEPPMDEKIERKAFMLLDNASDAMFVCDAVSSKVIYINDTACNLIGKSRQSCIGSQCYQLFWDRCKNCDRCYSIDKCSDYFYEEDSVMKDGKTQVHIKAKVDKWDDRLVKIHYLSLIKA